MRPTRIVQFGEGAFLRGFADWMIERLRRERSLELKVTLVQPRDSDGVAHLMAAGGRYQVLQQGIVDGQPRSSFLEITCIDAGLNSHRDPQAFAALGRDADVRVVISNTTEAGITWSDADAALNEPGEARSFPGKLTWLLSERQASSAGAKTLYVLPCELVADNGQRLKELVARMASAWGLGDEFHEWLESSVIFYDTLVDRIVSGRPADTPRLPSGAKDRFAVQTEWFHSWFLRGPDSLFDVLPFPSIGLNVHLVPDLAPYRALKVRLLNAVHTAMAVIGLRRGLQTVAEAVRDPTLGRWLRDMVTSELAPTIELAPDEVASFSDQVWQRFRNPFIEHRLESILLNTSAKLPARFAGAVAHRARCGQSSPLVGDVVANWLMLGRQRCLPEAQPTVEALDAAWAECDANRLGLNEFARRCLCAPELLGSEPWPVDFAGEVADLLVRALRSRD